MSTADAVEALASHGMTAKVIRPPTGRERNYDESTVIVCPTRRTKFCPECGLSTEDAGEKCACGAQIGGKIDFQVLDSWFGLVPPMNQNREGPIFALEHRYGKTTEQLVQRDGPHMAVGYEVGHAYNALIEGILQAPGLKNHQYLMTVEDDNILPWDAHLNLLESMHFARTEDGKPYDAISGLYHTKEDAHIPLAFGDAREFRRTGKITGFKPLDLASIPDCAACLDASVENHAHVVETLGIPMGCAIWKLSLFRELEAPWFVTKQNELRARRNGATQDLYFSQRCIEAGKRLGIDRRVYVGHKAADGTVY
jgi:hypothetical protein